MKNMKHMNEDAIAIRDDLLEQLEYYTALARNPGEYHPDDIEQAIAEIRSELSCFEILHENDEEADR